MAGPSKPGVYLEGLSDLRRALKRVDRELDRSLAKSLREIGKKVRDRVRAGALRFAQSHTLEKSLRYSVKQKTASIYSDVVYSRVQEYGGRVGHGAVIRRADAHHYMTEGIAASRRVIDSNLESVLDDLAAAYES